MKQSTINNTNTTKTISIITTDHINLNNKMRNSNYRDYLDKIKYIFDKYLDLFLIIISIVTASLLCYSSSLIKSFAIYEILTIITIPLVCKERFFYAYYLIGWSNLFLLPLILFINSSIQILPTGVLITASVLSVVKTGIFPVHSWLVSAYRASYPVSAVLHTAVLINSGILLLIQCLDKLIPNSGDMDNNNNDYFAIPITISLISIFFAFIRVCFEKNIKKILIFSTISTASSHLLLIFLILKHYTTDDSSLLDQFKMLFIFNNVSKFIIFVLFSQIKIDKVNQYVGTKYHLILASTFVVYLFISHYYEDLIIRKLFLNSNELLMLKFFNWSFVLTSTKLQFILNLSHFYIPVMIFYAIRYSIKPIKASVN